MDIERQILDFRCEILDEAAELRNICSEIVKNEMEVQSTETMIEKTFRYSVPFELVSMGFYKYYATLLL